MKVFLLILLFSLPIMANAQHKRMKKKVSVSSGTLFGYYGYNQSGYTRSNIRFSGPSYDFTLSDAVGHDQPLENGITTYFNPAKMTLPQYNLRLGYYFRNNWAVSLGYDHLKYVFADHNAVFLSGSIGAGVDTAWQGTFNAEPITTDPNHFGYDNSDGMNYLRIELTRSDQLFTVGDLDWFGITSNVGGSVGTLLTSNRYKFAQKEDLQTMSMSGYGVSLHFGARFEFFRHFFIQPNFSAGFMHQVNVDTRPNDPSSFARHAFGYIEGNIVAGFLLYVRSKNGCDSCPVW